MPVFRSPRGTLPAGRWAPSGAHSTRPWGRWARALASKLCRWGWAILPLTGGPGLRQSSSRVLTVQCPFLGLVGQVRVEEARGPARCTTKLPSRASWERQGRWLNPALAFWPFSQLPAATGSVCKVQTGAARTLPRSMAVTTAAITVAPTQCLAVLGNLHGAPCDKGPPKDTRPESRAPGLDPGNGHGESKCCVAGAPWWHQWEPHPGGEVSFLPSLWNVPVSLVLYQPSTG